MTPDNVCDTSVIFLFWQCMWQGIWYLTMYVTLQKISFYYKVCDRGYDTWQCMWRFSKYTFLTRYVTGDMTPDNVCDMRANILFLQSLWHGAMTPDNVCDTSVIFLFWQCMWQGIWYLTMYVTLQKIFFSYKVCDRGYDNPKQVARFKQCSFFYWNIFCVDIRINKIKLKRPKQGQYNHEHKNQQNQTKKTQTFSSSCSFFYLNI